MNCVLGCVLAISLCLLTPLPARATTAAKPPGKAIELAKTLTMITGVAISPMLGVGVVGAYDYFTAPAEKKASLAWYANPWFWAPVLLLVTGVAAKDAFGTVLPPGLKKPLDVAETIESKVSGLVMTGAFVPLTASVFGGIFTGSGAAAAGPELQLAGFAAINFAWLLNLVTVPLAMAVFVLVWLVGHVINVLILLSPLGPVDAALKAARVGLMSLVTATSFVNPWAGAILSVIVIVIAYFLAGWSFRLLVCGAVYVWDFVTRRRKRFQPAPTGNWMFTARPVDGAPIRTYGQLVREEAGGLRLDYRPWLVGPRQHARLPAGTYAVGRGLFYPELMRVEAERAITMLLLPPRYKSHETELTEIYRLAAVRDVGLLKGFKAIWRWLKGLFGAASVATPASASP